MGAVPLQPRSYSQQHEESHFEPNRRADRRRLCIGCTLLTGSLLLLAGKRKAGLLVTIAGTTLAMLEEQELVSRWWNALPGYLDTAQGMIDQANQTIDDLNAKRERIVSLFSR